MQTPTDANDTPRNPPRHIYGYGAWSGWWHFPVALTLATTATVVAAVLIAGVGTGAEGVAPPTTATRGAVPTP